MPIGFRPDLAVGKALDLSGANIGSLPLHRPELDLDLTSLIKDLRVLKVNSGAVTGICVRGMVKIRDFLAAFGPCVIDVQDVLLTFANLHDPEPKEAAEGLLKTLSPLTEQLRHAAKEYQTFLLEVDKFPIRRDDPKVSLPHTSDMQLPVIAARTTPISLLNLVVMELSKVAANLAPLAAGHGSIDSFVRAKEVSAAASNQLATVFTADLKSVAPTIRTLSLIIYPHSPLL